MLNAVQVLEGKENANLRLSLTTQDGFVKIQVRDNGPGIEQERLETIFRPYWSSRAGGTGLGLPVTRRIVEAHHGEISVESTLGEGTCFEIVLPDAPPGTDDSNRLKTSSPQTASIPINPGNHPKPAVRARRSR